MYLYETCLILSAQVPDSEVDELLAKLQKPLTDAGAEFQKICRWGRRKLAYPINKQADGVYVVMFYDHPTPGDSISVFERNCRYNDNVLRATTIKVPKKIHGQEIEPIYPEPGFLADFNMAPRPRMPRRREGESYDRGRRHDRPPRSDAPRPDATRTDAPKPEEPKADAPAPGAVATEEKKPEATGGEA